MVIVNGDRNRYFLRGDRIQDKVLNVLERLIVVTYTRQRIGHQGRVRFRPRRPILVRCESI